MARWEEITEKDKVQQMDSPLPPTLTELAKTHYSSKDLLCCEAATQPLAKQVVSALCDLTKEQTYSHRWHEYRVGCAISSKAYQVITKVKEGVSTSNNALLKQIMNYVPQAHS